MNTIYSNSEQKFVKGYLVYADSDLVLFQDEDCSVAVDPDELIDAFKKGLLNIVDGDEIFKPISADLTNSTFNAVTTTTVETVTSVIVNTYLCEAAD